MQSVSDFENLRVEVSRLFHSDYGLELGLGSTFRGEARRGEDEAISCPRLATSSLESLEVSRIVCTT